MDFLPPMVSLCCFLAVCTVRTAAGLQPWAPSLEGEAFLEVRENRRKGDGERGR